MRLFRTVICVLGFLSLAAPVASASPIAACGAQFQYSCAQATPGGYSIITPIAATGVTEITGYTTAGAVVFDKTIPIPPNGPAGYVVQGEVIEAEKQVALQSGLAGSLPACTSTSSSACLVNTFNQAFSTSTSVTYSFVANDTAVTQRADQYATTLIATLNGNVVSSQTFDDAFGSLAVQSALLSLSGSLSGAGSPFLVSGSTNLLGSQVSFEQTGMQLTANEQVLTATTFGPAYVAGCPTDQCTFFGPEYSPQISFVLLGQTNFNINTDLELAIDRNVITTSDFLTAQTYEIDGFTTSSTPEPSTCALTAGGALGLLVFKVRRAPSGRRLN